MCVLVDGEVIDAGVLYFRQTMMPPVPPWVEEVRERERERAIWKTIEGRKGAMNALRIKRITSLNTQVNCQSAISTSLIEITKNHKHYFNKY